MTDLPEAVVRVGLAAWSEVREYGWDEPAVLGVMGEKLCLIEIAETNRHRMILDIVDDYDVADGNLAVDIAFFGEAGGFFASPVNFLESWPRSLADAPVDVFIDTHHKATFTKVGDEMVTSVRFATAFRERPPKRRFRFRANEYEEAMSELAREARRLRDDLLAAAEERTPQKVKSLQEALKRWPA